MSVFFYSFYKKKLAEGLFYQENNEGNPPSPPGFSFLINIAGDPLVNNEGIYLVGGDFGPVFSFLINDAADTLVDDEQVYLIGSDIS